MVYLSSLACADPLNLESQVRELIRAGHNCFHIDLMDGHYVPNLCMNLDLVKALKKRFDCVIDVHLMVDNPFEYVDACGEAGVDMVTFHFSGVNFPFRLLNEIRRKGMKAGMVLNPKDHPDQLGELLPLLDYCLIMSVEPGFAGQSFMNMAYDKIQYLNEKRKQENLHFKISVDGGIDVTAGRKCKERGADMLVMGVFSFFNGKQPLYDACKTYVSQVEA